jgi:hypothetical protein
MTNKLSSKMFGNYVCNLCDYNSCRKSQYDRHLLSLKHQIRTNTNKCAENSSNTFDTISIIHKQHSCQCGKIFKHASSLWNHRNKCEVENEKKHISSNTILPNLEIDKEMLIKMLLKNQEVMENVILKNQDVMEKMIEIIPSIGNQVHTNSHNTTNNQFNIQMFLNEHCKNAMNLTDFIDSLPITAATYDSTIENGLTKTITNMITNGLNKLDILERPIHCTDATRKTLYVKESDIWEKDTELLKVVEGIKTLIRKKRTLISRWKEANRGWDTVESKQMRFTDLICNIMTDVDFDEKETGKIVRSISKSVYLDSEEKKKYLC